MPSAQVLEASPEGTGAEKASKVIDQNTDAPSKSRTENATVFDLPSSSTTEKFNPGWRFYASFISLCIITLAVALNATSLSVALPVRNNLGSPPMASFEPLCLFSSCLLAPRAVQ